MELAPEPGRVITPVRGRERAAESPTSVAESSTDPERWRREPQRCEPHGRAVPSSHLTRRDVVRKLILAGLTGLVLATIGRPGIAADKPPALTDAAPTNSSAG